MSSDESSEARFGVYVEALTGVLGHADRATPLRHYCTGLLMPAERKSVEPIAAVTAPARVAAQHQSLLHFVGQAPWSDAAMLSKVRDLVLPAIEGTGPIEAWIIDDTGFPKKGRHSVGVARQYCGQLGKQDNCQVAVTLSLANHTASLPVAYRLYLPRRSGLMIEIGAKRQACLRRSPSRPSPRLRSTRSVRLPKPACHAGPSSWMPVMAPIRSCAPTSPRSGSLMSPGSCRTPPFGRKGPHRCRPSRGRAGDGRPS